MLGNNNVKRRRGESNALDCFEMHKNGDGEVILKDSEKFKCNVDADLKIKHWKNRKTTQLSILWDG